MRRVISRITLTTLLAPALISADSAPPSAPAPAPAPNIRAVMHKQYTVSRAPYKIIRQEIDAGNKAPDWEKVQEALAKFDTLAASLVGTTPPEGSAESWRLLIEKHRADVKAMDDAIGSRDVVALCAAERRVAGSCRTCHAIHRQARGD